MKPSAEVMPNQRLEEAIAEYLRSHPDFFNRHLELLDNLRIPHDCAPAVSLLERQLQRLRDENTELKDRLRELVNVARDNESLAQRMQALMLGLLEAQDLLTTVDAVQAVLRDDFHADFTVLKLLAEPAKAVQGGTLGACFSSEQQLAPLQRILGGRQAFCGRLTSAQASCLFDDPDEVGSASLIVLQGDGWWGVLAVGSRDAERFWSGMGTLFLHRIGELLSQALRPYLLPRANSDHP